MYVTVGYLFYLNYFYLISTYIHIQNLYLRSDNSIIFIIRNITSITSIFLTDSVHVNLFSGQKENKNEIFIASIYMKIS